MKYLPLFPLNTVLFPGLPLYLHIFEERYKLMIKEVMDAERTFGVLLIRSGQEANGPLAQTFTIGCTARLLRVETLPDGNMNLTAIGEERYRVEKYNQQMPYLRGEVESIPIEIISDLTRFKDASSPFRSLIMRYLSQLGEVSARQDPSLIAQTRDPIQLPEDPFRLLMAACALLRVPMVEKQRLLELSSVEEILDAAVRLYQREYAVNINLMDISEEVARRSSQLN